MNSNGWKVNKNVEENKINGMKDDELRKIVNSRC